MSKILYLQASPRDRSHARAVANAFLESYAKTHPQDTIETLDIFTADLPSFDGLKVQAKYVILNGLTHSPEERQAWDAVEKIIHHFLAADKYVFSVPMWNFGIPYRLKQYFDIIVQPGYTFSFSPETGYTGLVTGKPVAVINARGGEYHDNASSAAFDMQKAYMELILRFIGFTAIHSILVQPTLAGGPDGAIAARNTAIDKARQLALKF